MSRFSQTDDRVDSDRLLRHRESLREVIESISSELELGPLLTRIVRHACELLDATCGTIGLYDDTQRVARQAALFNIGNPDTTEIPHGIGLTGMVLDRRGPVLLERYDEIAVRTLPERLDDHTAVGVPIPWRDRLIGVFCVFAPPPRRFEPEDVEVLELFARHAAIAIQNARQFQREAARCERLAMIARVGRSLASHLDLDQLCTHAVEMLHRCLGYPNTGLGLIEPGMPETIVIRHVGGGFARATPYERRIHISQGVMGAAARERRVQMVQDVRNDPRYVPPPFPADIVAELATPIMLGDQVFGIINLESPNRFDEEHVHEVQIIADYLAVAIQNSRLFSEAQRLAAFLERQRLALEIHDSITQMVFSASLNAQAIAPTWRVDPAEGERLSARVVEQTRTALAELRALLQEMNPREASPDDFEGMSELGRLRHLGLAEMVRAEACRAVDGRLACEIEVRGYRSQSGDIEEALFRVFQEALHNVVKHARASWVQISLRCADGGVILSVTDNGVGFDLGAETTASPNGYGLRNMRKRVAALGGSVDVRSRRGVGTEVEVLVMGGGGS